MKQSILLLALFCFTISNAQKSKKITASGVNKTITKTTAEYDKIKVETSFSVKLVEGKEGNIKIEGDENIIQYIKAEVSNNILTVAFEKDIYVKYNNASNIQITIPFKKIDGFTFSGSGSLSTSDVINSDTLDVDISGSGSVVFETSAKNVTITKSGSGSLTAKGKATNLKITATGSGNINAGQLVSEKAIADKSGSGNLKINCTKNLTIKNSGSGSVSYTGKPKKVDESSTGSGKISLN